MSQTKAINKMQREAKFERIFKQLDTIVNYEEFYNYQFY